MKLLHTSDWHLGAQEGTRSLYEDQIYFIDQICSAVREQGIDAVLLAGDIYDRSVGSAEAVTLYDGAMTRLCTELGVQVYAIAGNHDSAERLSTCNALLERAGLYIKGELTADITPISVGNIQLFLLPWITEERVRSVFPDKKDEIRNLTDAYRTVTDAMRTKFAQGKRHIILSHAFITDTETSESDRAAVIGFATQVPASVFDGFDYVALGHIHKPQDVSDTVRYSGTPMPYAFGSEEKQVKSVTVIDTDTMTHTVIPLPLYHKRTTLTGTMEELMNPTCDTETRNGYVRLQVTDIHLGLEAMSELRTVYPNILDMRGVTYESDSETVTMTMEELERMEASPMEVFRQYFSDIVKDEPSEHLEELFRDVLACEE